MARSLARTQPIDGSPPAPGPSWPACLAPPYSRWLGVGRVEFQFNQGGAARVFWGPPAIAWLVTEARSRRAGGDSVVFRTDGPRCGTTPPERARLDPGSTIVRHLRALDDAFLRHPDGTQHGRAAQGPTGTEVKSGL